MSPTLWFILVAVALIALVVCAVAYTGTARFVALWNALPAPARSFVNVIVGAAITATAGYLLSVLRGEPFNVTTWWAAVAAALSTAVSTILVRALNKADTAYGIGKKTTATVLTVVPPATDAAKPEGQ